MVVVVVVVDCVLDNSLGSLEVRVAVDCVAIAWIAVAWVVVAWVAIA